MKLSFLKVSIYLNIVLLFAVLLLISKMGLLDGVLSSIRPLLESSGKRDLTPSSQSPTDNLPSDPGWQNQVKSQAKSIQGKKYRSCLFGDSISAGLHNTIEPRTFNFAINGMSTVSLIQQLKILTAANLKCSQVIVAIGTNDAWYNISDELFIKNLKRTIDICRQTGAKPIVFIPAFYATVAASHNPSMAGTNERIDQLNALIGKVAATEQVLVATDSTKQLFNNHALNENLTVDGVHLNDDGLTLYRLALLRIINPSCHLL